MATTDGTALRTLLGTILPRFQEPFLACSSLLSIRGGGGVTNKSTNKGDKLSMSIRITAYFQHGVALHVGSGQRYALVLLHVLARRGSRVRYLFVRFRRSLALSEAQAAETAGGSTEGLSKLIEAWSQSLRPL